MPPWSHLHPLIVHFPIALLLVAPALVVLGLALPELRPGLHAAALALLLAGTLGTLAALVTGEAAAASAQRTAALRVALDRHEHFAQLAALLFALLTLLFATLFFWARFRREAPLGLYLLWLAAAAGAMPVLALAAHFGGRMVHELGLHLPTP